MPKVICVDNFGRDYNGGRSERVAGENLSEEEAKRLAAELNGKYGGEDSLDWYVVKPDDYKPYVFEGY